LPCAAEDSTASRSTMLSACTSKGCHWSGSATAWASTPRPSARHSAPKASRCGRPGNATKRSLADARATRSITGASSWGTR
jgi:hypothetical protein